MTDLESGLPPRRKRYGQNFLSDPNIIRRIIDTLAPQPGDHLFEIGPGRGALTDHLVKTGNRLDVIEIDHDLVRLLEARYAGQAVQIHQGDVLQFDLTSLATGRTLRVIGNLPYNISTPLLFRLFEQSAVIADMHLMVQREVADRLVASPQTAAYGRLGIMASYFCNIERCFTVPPTAFSPRPKVQSAIIRCTPYTDPPVPALDPVALRRLVTQAFTQRRKVLRNSLKPLLDEHEIEALGIDSRARPETLELRQFVLLSDYLVTRDREQE